jgi:hypothetical protein
VDETWVFGDLLGIVRYYYLRWGPEDLRSRSTLVGST